MKYYLSNVLNGFKPVGAYVELEIKMRQTPNFVVVDIDQDDMPEILFTYTYMGEKYIGVLKRRNMQWYFEQTMPEREQKAIGLGNLVNTVGDGVITPNDVGRVVNMEMLFGNKAQAFVSLVNDAVTHGIVSQGQMNMQPNQSMNQPMNMQSNQSMNQPMNMQPNQSMNQPMNMQPNQFMNQPMNMQPNQPISAEFTQPMNTQANQQANLSNANLQNLTEAQIAQILSEQLPLPQQIGTPSAQQALQENVITPIMNVTETPAAVNETPFVQANPMMNIPNIPIANAEDINLQNLTEAQIIQIIGEKLPPSQLINTLASQQALQENVVTPIMNVNETAAVVNETPFIQGTPMVNSGTTGQQPMQNPSSTIGQNLNQNINLDKEVINFAQADVTGDGRIDSIYLVGDRQVGDPTRHIENMGLRVRTDGKILSVDFPYGNGYSPILFVGDLTRDGIPDVLVNMFSSSTGGFITSYIYTFENGVPRMLFDSKVFNDLYTGKVIYEDNYIVRVLTNRPPWQYTIDLRDRDPGYLSSLYDQNGRLRRPTEGTLLGLNSLNPIDYDVNGEFNISSIQRVIGIGNLDTLGLVETYLSWRDATSRFEPFMQYLSVLGRPR